MSLRALLRWIGPVGAAFVACGVGWSGAQVGPVQPGPVGYFADKCERCHGPEGSNYGDEFGKGLSDSGLHEKVSAMARGPAMAPLAGRPLEALVALHRSLIAHEPFLAWTGVTAQSITGEATSGAIVQAKAGSRTLTVSRSGSKWSIRLPAGVSAGRVVLVAARGAKKSTLRLAEAAWTHAKPLAR